MTLITDLNDDVLIQIFSLLDQKSLICASKVNNWSSLIQTSHNLMMRSTLSIIGKYEREFNIQDPIGGQHVNLLLDILDLNPEIHKIIDDHKQSLRKVILKRFSTDNKYLSRLVGFQEIKCLRSRFRPDYELEQLDWPELKALRIDDCNIEIAKVFSKAKLQKLELIKTTLFNYSELKTASLIDTFIDNQLSSLTELRLVDTEIDCEYLLKFFECKNLKLVEIDQKLLAHRIEFLQTLSNNFSWKKLRLRGSPYNVEDVENIFQMNRNLTKIAFNFENFGEKDEILGKIYSTSPQIQHLRLSMQFGAIPKSKFTFDSLHMLEIEGVRYFAQLLKVKRLIENCPKIRNLKIHWIGGHAMNNEVLGDILRSSKIESVHLGRKTDSFELTQQNIDLIASEGENLRKFSTFSSNVEGMKKKMMALDNKRVQVTILDRNYEEVENEKPISRKRKFRSYIFDSFLKNSEPSTVTFET